uniref:Acyltransferase 3 domain-containing protein n=1 Tax=Strombidium inclinatum TaxID=197538 RepID=A0A7S3IWR1_9SPIT|mmetsp:Transcript_5897/g.9565  ORF Transcript_5897/g.9565 Transcript_5897/m.9565 type:complete len:534 (+) Transcript_5897:889-2490(+)
MVESLRKSSHHSFYEGGEHSHKESMVLHNPEASLKLIDETSKPSPDDQFTQVVHGFSLTHAYDYLAGSRCRPWDDRELDVLDGYKFFSFVLISIAQTSYMLAYTSVIDLLQLFALLRMVSVAQFLASNLGLETFVFVSVFYGAYKCRQIMEARSGLLRPLDFLKIYFRKFLRLAPAYYMMWIIMWAVIPRLASGPIWNFTDIDFETCKEQWLPTLFFMGNLIPKEMKPYEGCYQFAWPLQVDMQIALLVPFIALVYWKSRVAGNTLMVLFIFTNVAVNMYYSYTYDLKIGFLHTTNYFLLQAIISKPWTKTANIGFAFIMVDIYFQILAYRKVKASAEKSLKFPVLHKIHTKGWLGNLILLGGLALIFTNFFFCTHWNADPMDATKFGNAIYYGLSRPLWILGVAMVLFSIFTGHFGKAKAFLSTNNMRIIAKSVAIGTVLEMAVAQGLFNSYATPEGISLTFPTCLLFGLGFIMCTMVVAVILMILIEFPFTRLIQNFLTPYISHDPLLAKHYAKTQEPEKKPSLLEGSTLK